MTKPGSDDADPKSEKPEGESAAVRVQADAASEREDTEDTVRVEDADAADIAISDDAELEQKTQAVKPANAKRRIKRTPERSRSAKADQRDQETPEGEEEEPSDVTEPADADDSSEAEAAIPDDVEGAESAEEDKPAKAKRRVGWSRILVYGVLPGLALLLTAAAGFLKWQDSSARESQLARIESVSAAKDSTIALLSYKSDTVEKELEAAKSRMTGTFKESYSQLINDVVIPGAKREHISTTATVPAAASVSATPNHAVTLLFVNQTATVGKNPPSDTTSSVRVTLDKIGGRWLISGFDPV
jgi:Mce-associated membrane protein